METFTDLTKLPVPILVTFLCNMLGVALKRAHWVDNNKIPLILICFGAICFTLIAPAAGIKSDVRFPIAYDLIVGAALGGFSVGLHQALRGKNPLNGNGHTEIIKKDEKDPPSTGSK